MYFLSVGVAVPSSPVGVRSDVLALRRGTVDGGRMVRARRCLVELRGLT